MMQSLAGADDMYMAAVFMGKAEFIAEETKLKQARFGTDAARCGLF
jgi:hypothetical protein